MMKRKTDTVEYEHSSRFFPVHRKDEPRKTREEFSKIFYQLFKKAISLFWNSL